MNTPDLKRWTAWAGGPAALLAVLGVQVLLGLVWLIEPAVAFGLVLAAVGLFVVVRAPLLGVAMLLASRVLSTGALVFLRVGRIGIGPFELMLLACLLALAIQAIRRGQRLWLPWPWKWPFLVFSAWVGLSLYWSVDRGDGLAELLPLGLVVANTTLVLAFVRTWEEVRQMLIAWLATCVFIGVATALASSSGVQFGVAFEAASGGGRSTGLGQQPNWFAMNLYFIIPTALGLGVVERGWRRAAWVGGALFVVFTMLQAGSRGGVGATIIASGLVALANPRFRAWALGGAAVVAAGIVGSVTFDVGGLGVIVARASRGVLFQENYRPWNWQACLEMFRDTGGRGIGAGGYATLLPQYNYLLSQSLYDYPHGIPWELIAHYGVPGLVIFGWLVLVVARMSWRTIRAAQGHPAEVVAWAMPAAMVGYGAWSFVEFSVSEKPFWEFLALYTALSLALQRSAAGYDSSDEPVRSETAHPRSG
ncbi:MAG: O-antigen ligase family protein [Alphaproteobacteria bacterium]|nr:O-antigen ligase family protein [Alphaproteobacteria bacterium]MCB9792630.1 O-antigen ligase family protein [Alphaproteobacteria bacterium]